MSNNRLTKQSRLRSSLASHSSLGVLFALWCAACSSSSTPDSDTRDVDAGATSSPTDGTSGSSETVSSAPSQDSDAGQTSDAQDTSGDVTSDATGDATGDATEDAGVSEPSDDGGITSEPPQSDAGSTDESDGGSSEDPWAGCPASAVPQDPEWPIQVNATPDAIYCATFNESRTLQEEQLVKMQLRIAPGVHRVPEGPIEALVLPICVRDQAESRGVVSGNVDVAKTQGGTTTGYTLRFDQGFGDEDPRHLRLTLDQMFGNSLDVQFTLDGVESSGFDGYQSIELCEFEDDYCVTNVIFTSCAYESGELNTHVVEFDGGEVTFELRLGDSFAGTEPGAFVGAHGTFDGEAFAQDDYFKLIYHPTHHHFERTFAVLFDEPRGNVCGLEVSALEPFGDDVPDRAYTVDCELNRIEELTVSSHSLTRGNL